MDRIERAFTRFHAKNPSVYTQLRDMALRLKRTGKSTYSISALFEVLRYERALQTIGDDGLKLNNNYRALYARMIARNEPELQEFFRMRLRRARYDPDQIVGPDDYPAPAVDAWDQVLRVR